MMQENENGSGRLILVRLAAELATKSRRTRSNFLRRLRRNLQDALETTDAPFELESGWGRMYVRTPSPESGELLGRIFGISSASSVDVVVSAELNEIVRAGEAE